jgi:hypothetical protein
VHTLEAFQTKIWNIILTIMEHFTEFISVLNLLGFWRTSFSALIDYNTKYMDVDLLETFSRDLQNH